MSSKQEFEESTPEKSLNADLIPKLEEATGVLRGGQSGGRKAAGLDAAQRASEEEALQSSLESSDLEDLVRDVRLRLTGPQRGKGRSRTVARDLRQVRLSPAQRLLILDTWIRSQLPAREFSAMFGLSPHTLYGWKQRFDKLGPAGLEDRARGRPTGSRLPEPTRRAILMMKSMHPDWGQDRLHAMLLRSDGLSASPGAIARVLQDVGYKVESEPTVPHEPKVTRFERARANQLWQTDLFTFLLRRQNRRVWMVAFMDDHSRFIVGYGIYASSSGALVREVLEAAIAGFGAPEELLSDNGPQYHTWRGKSAFTQLLERRGIKHIVARPRHPQTLGKIERFWGTLWRELLETAIFQGLDEARVRVGHFIDHYNFQRTHSGIANLVPADRYFAAAETVRKSLEERVASNALSLAKDGAPRKSFYLTGRVGDETIALHAQGGRVVLTKGDGTREEVDLTSEGRRVEPGVDASMPPPVAVCGQASELIGAEVEALQAEALMPGQSALDAALFDLSQSLGAEKPVEDDEPSPEVEA